MSYPQPSRRPGSAAWADVYGSLDFGPTTATAGAVGAARVAAVGDANEAGRPLELNVGPDFVAQPAGVLVLLVGALIVLSLSD